MSLSRRSIIKMGRMGLIGVWGGSESTAIAGQQPEHPPAGKPLMLAPENADIAAIARVENLFWCDIMMEHAAFFALLMPGADLATQRAQAENYQRTFQAQVQRARSATIDHNNFAAFNRSTVELIKPFIDYKRRMLDGQAAGKLRSLVFPLFFEHTAHEAERAVARLQKIEGGDPTVNY